MNMPGLIRAEITDKSSSSGRWLYEWKEVRAALADGADEDPSPQRTGEFDNSPAVEINDHEVSVGTVVWLRPRGLVGGTLWWEFQYEVGGAAVYGQATLGSQYDFTSSANDTYLNTGLSITLPSAGTYEIGYTALLVANASAAGGQIVGRVYNVTASGDLAISASYITTQVANVNIRSHVTIVFQLTVTVSTALRLDVYKTSGVTWNLARVEGPQYAARMWYKKLS